MCLYVLLTATVVIYGHSFVTLLSNLPVSSIVSTNSALNAWCIHVLCVH